MKKKILAIIPLLILTLLAFYIKPIIDGKNESNHQSTGLLPEELQILSVINGSNIYQYNLALEKIALDHHAFRSGGSPGANDTLAWVVEKFRSFGLEAYNESFQFTNWNLLTKPVLTIDEDGNPNTVGDQLNLTSFISDHLSWSTGQTGVFSDLVVLPLPTANNREEIGLYPLNQAQWNSIDTTGRILLIGREVTWDSNWRQTFANKISAQTPSAIVFTWWYSWMSFSPPFVSSGGGRQSSGANYWNLEVPVGWADHQDGLTMRNMENSLDIFARVFIDSEIGYGAHYNAIAKITGYDEPEKYIIVSSHLDTVTVPGFCDNGAGTAGVIELARVFSEAMTQGLYRPRFSVLFIAFADEELGLVGSINYLIRHKNEIGNTIAVINLDCIGSDNFEISETQPDPGTGLDLDDVVLRAAQDLSIVATVIAPGGSDQETFRNPPWADGFYSSFWGLNAGINSVPPVEPSVLLISSPLLYGDYWDMGVSGWIHTPYDNSTSTTSLSWIEEDDLENHVKTAALVMVRVSGADEWQS